MRRFVRGTFLLATTLMILACGGEPFQALGQRSSDWIGEPTIPTTTTVAVTVPIVVGGEVLRWFNDSIISRSPDDLEALRREIFARGAGELIIQASRAEIASLVPDLKFPTLAPVGSQYVTSQLVFEGSGALSEDPIAGFGIWSSEPYTRSRSVAQVVVLWVSRDEPGADDISANPDSVTCARFAGRATNGCEILTIGDVPVWSLKADNGRTLIWYDGIYRYEMFGRPFVSPEALKEMASTFEPIGQLTVAGG